MTRNSPTAWPHTNVHPVHCVWIHAPLRSIETGSIPAASGRKISRLVRDSLGIRVDYAAARIEAHTKYGTFQLFYDEDGLQGGGTQPAAVIPGIGVFTGTTALVPLDTTTATALRDALIPHVQYMPLQEARSRFPDLVSVSYVCGQAGHVHVVTEHTT